jgi:LuxR family maltose regulon positive regulatory protein
VAQLIGEASESLRRRGEIVTLTHWIQALPRSIRHVHPVLCLNYARALLDLGRVADAETYILEADHWLEKHAQTGDPQVDSIRGRVLTLRAQVAGTRGEFAPAIELSQRARELLAHDDAFWRSLVALNLAETFRFTSRWAEAKESYREAAALSGGAGDHTVALYALCSRGEVLEAEGQLRQAAGQFEEVLELARTGGVPNAAATGYAFIGLGRMHYEWNELEAALHEIQTGLARGEQAEMTHVLLRGYLALARIRTAQNDLEAALAALLKADAVAEKIGLPQVKVWIGAQRAQVWLAGGDLEAASDWASRLPGETQDVIYPSVPIALAKVWLAQRQPEKALSLLDHALHSAQAVGRLGNAIRILAVRAIVSHAQGQPGQAFACLEQALELAEPQGYVRAFADEGAPMARLLRRMLTRSSTPEYVRRLLEALGESTELDVPVVSSLIDPLSARELEVLRLIVEGATNKEIADELVLTVNTVKRHISNIFHKLHVSNRVQAIAQARELNLL